MRTVGSFEAKTHLAELLNSAERGERILITKRGRPVAMLVPPPATDDRESVRATVEAMLAYRDRAGLTAGCPLKELIDEGRRR